MAKYIVKRLLYMVLIALLLSFMIYVIYNMVPNDRAATDARAEVNADKNHKLDYDEIYTKYQRQYGLDGNLAVRYLRWLGVYPFTNADGTTGECNGLLQGNFGYSYSYGRSAVELIKEPMKNTMFINIFATILALGITIPLGITCATKKGSKLDTGVQVGTIIGYSLPTFIIAIAFIFVFCVLLGWFPSSGMKTPGSDYTGWAWFADRAKYMALPLIVMTFCSLGGMTRYVRASMVEALSMDCIKTARAKGLNEKVVIYSHAWRNALIPVVTLVVGWFIGIFSGSIMMEQIFAINGVGKIYIEALNNQDYEVVLCLQMFYIVIALVGNIIIDLIYGFIDPRIRVAN